ncbi:putative metalloprotease CJM1_0395 family protein [Gayadomonas joobiniege]|uniref:putative metalloprotease CJM1_0395 family protein n=1 Tax=Gayadomonas joobiniege TaxID=1234606 RepID=UPI0003729586|nr:putative metalloprotease CJM1_0395 family protein [Gayadomonas joobiniege]
MNISPQYPTNLTLNLANPQTEAVRREVLSPQKVTENQPNQAQPRDPGVSSRPEYPKAASQTPLTYDYIRSNIYQNRVAQNKNNASQQQNKQEDGNLTKNNKPYSEQEQKELTELKARDQEVRQHEQAHATTGGQYAGAPSYEFERGPDGKNYAVGGEVQIDVSEVANDPAATIQKMAQVQRAALAPAEPSATDRQVAAEAAQKAQQARAELQQKNAKETLQNNQHASRQTTAADVFTSQPTPSYQAPETLEVRDERVNARALKIASFYAASSRTHEQPAFSRYA